MESKQLSYHVEEISAQMCRQIHILDAFNSPNLIDHFIEAIDIITRNLNADFICQPGQKRWDKGNRSCRASSGDATMQMQRHLAVGGGCQQLIAAHALVPADAPIERKAGIIVREAI